MKYISTGDQLANIFTKSLSTSRFHFLRSKIMVFVEPMVLRGMIEEEHISMKLMKKMRIMANLQR